MLSNNSKTARFMARIVTLIFALSSISVFRAEAQGHAYKIEHDVTYATIDGIDLMLSIAYPTDGEGPFPGLIMICGNGWGMSNYRRTFYAGRIQRAAADGYVAMTVDYRYTNLREAGRPRYPFPAQLHDVKCAVRWLRANAEKYHLDTERIGAMGWSSGGHLSLMLGLTSPEDGLEGSVGYPGFSSKVQAVVSSAGPIELKSLYEEAESASRQILLSFIGGPPSQYPAEYAAASPVNYVTPGDAPALIIHGSMDSSVVVRQALIIDAKMTEVGVEHTLIIREGGKHVDFSGELEAWNFLDAKLKRPKSP